MAVIGSTTHLYFLIITCSTLFLPSATATATTTTNELATKICKKTTNYTFCHDVIYSDPRASTADRYVLSYIAFGQTYLNATDTEQYINATLKSMESGHGGKSKSGTAAVLYAGMKKCRRYYKEAVRALVETLGNLDSETFYGLDKLAIDVGGCASGCEASFRGHSPMSNRNDNLVKLSEICLLVSKLYSYA